MLARKRAEFLKFTQVLNRARDCLGKSWEHISTQEDASDVLNIEEMDSTKSESGFNMDFCQKNGSGESIGDLSELYWNAALVKKNFQDILKRAIAFCEIPVSSLEIAPLKSKDAAQDKASFNYSMRPGPGTAWLFDILRASITCSSFEEIKKIVAYLESNEDQAQVLRLKNRFKRPLPTMYRDILMNIKVDLGEGVSHICEVQIHFNRIRDLSLTVCSSQSAFEYFHTFFHGVGLTNSEINMKVQLLHDVQKFSDREKLHKFVKKALDSSNKVKLNSLQWAMRFTGEYFLAEAALRKLLHLQTVEEQRPDTDTETMATLDALANILQSQNIHSEAELCIKRLAMARKSVWGQDDYRAMKSLDELALVLQKQKKFDGAAQIHRRMLSIKEAILGKDHESTLRTMDSLCDCLMELKKFPEAEDLSRRILAMRERVLGANHHVTLSAMHILATALRHRGCSKEAERVFRRLREMRLSELGMQHPIALKATENLAMVLQDMRRYKEAVILHSSVYSIREKSQGPTHLDTIASQINIAYLYFLQNQFLMAAKTFEAAHQNYVTALGPEHKRAEHTRRQGQACLRLANRLATKFTDPEQASLFVWLNTCSTVGAGREFEHARRCEHCDVAITFFRREHHCRVCVRALCHSCSALRKIVTVVHPSHAVRVCDCCSEALTLCTSSRTGGAAQNKSAEEISCLLGGDDYADADVGVDAADLEYSTIKSVISYEVRDRTPLDKDLRRRASSSAAGGGSVGAVVGGRKAGHDSSPETTNSSSSGGSTQSSPSLFFSPMI